MRTLELNVNHRGSVSLFILSTFFCPSLVHKPPKEQQKHAALLKLCHYVATHVLQWRGMSHRWLWKQTHTHTYMFLWWQDNWHGVQAISGSAEFNYVKYPRFNSREYRDIFAFSVRCVSCVTFFEFVLTTQVKWSTCLFPVETDPLEVQRKACWSIVGVEAKLSFPPGSRPHL